MLVRERAGKKTVQKTHEKGERVKVKGSQGVQAGSVSIAGAKALKPLTFSFLLDKFVKAF